ncbi:MAG: hypothetical protein SCARUB_01554 [Candidatus Scalindua rubra]|uniref:Uncharacterized protein n=1 Tax=Candidatus Scalindua rubra TaxID=1872076 RepID=A0A1E3XCH4_9BACT|nr:MAG: hypothetical protein SCARUB_01554 [Candidatus Scalindua rubra]
MGQSELIKAIGEFEKLVELNPYFLEAYGFAYIVDTKGMLGFLDTKR